MEYKNTDFPQYRKLENEKSFYKIESDIKFIELQKMGTSVFRFEIVAEKYPEILRIKEMVECEAPYQISNAFEFNELLKD